MRTSSDSASTNSDSQGHTRAGLSGKRKNARLPPGPRGWPLLGTFPQVLKDPLRLFERGRADFGETVLFRFGPYRYVLIHRPEDIRRVLVQGHANYHKSPTYQGLKLVLGTGLVTSEGDFWRRQRKLAQPAFHHRALLGLAEDMNRCTTQMLEDWRGRGAEFSTDLHHEMMRLTLRIVGHTLFSTELGADADKVGPAIEACLEHANAAAESMMLIPNWVPTPRNLRFKRNKAVLDEMVNKIIAQRRAGDEPERPDLLSMLMSATDESGEERMNDPQLFDEIMTLALAGHETTANLLTWTFVLLARHPEIADKCRAEVDAQLQGRTPSVDDLKSLPYIGQVLDESMRIYPPVWNFERVALQDDELDGYHIPAGTIVAISPWTLHRHPERWAMPGVFDPERFSQEQVKDRERWHYLPFGGGPRVCIGNAFAKMEAKLLLAAILGNYDIALEPGARIELEPGITLRPKHGVPVRVRAREGA